MFRWTSVTKDQEKFFWVVPASNATWSVEIYLVLWTYWVHSWKHMYPIGIFVWLLQFGFDLFRLFCYWIQYINEETLSWWEMINATWDFRRRWQINMESMQQKCLILRHSLFAILTVHSVCILSEVCNIWK